MSADDRKKVLRRQMLKTLESLSREELSSASRIICSGLLDFIRKKDIRSVFCYLSMSGEIDMDGLIGDLLEDGRDVYVPYIRGRDMLAVRYCQDTELASNAFGIREPVAAEVCSEDIGLAVVPGLAFDEHLNRLGRGGGFYDRFLAGKGIIKAGVFGSWQKISEVPNNQYDVVLDAVFTEKDTIFLYKDSII